MSRPSSTLQPFHLEQVDIMNDQPSKEVLICGACGGTIESGAEIRTRHDVYHKAHAPRFRNRYDPRVTRPVESREIRPL